VPPPFASRRSSKILQGDIFGNVSPDICWGSIVKLSGTIANVLFLEALVVELCTVSCGFVSPFLEIVAPVSSSHAMSVSKSITF